MTLILSQFDKIRNNFFVYEIVDYFCLRVHGRILCKHVTYVVHIFLYEFQIFDSFLVENFHPHHITKQIYFLSEPKSCSSFVSYTLQLSHHLAILWDTSQFHLVSGNKQIR